MEPRKKQDRNILSLDSKASPGLIFIWKSLIFLFFKHLSDVSLLMPWNFYLLNVHSAGVGGGVASIYVMGLNMSSSKSVLVDLLAWLSLLSSDILHTPPLTIPNSSKHAGDALASVFNNF
jgi:hypothetical protein